MSKYEDFTSLNSLTDDAAMPACADKKCKLPRLFKDVKERIGRSPFEAQESLLAMLKKKYEEHLKTCTKNKSFADLGVDFKGFKLRRHTEWESKETKKPSDALPEEVRLGECLTT